VSEGEHCTLVFGYSDVIVCIGFAAAGQNAYLSDCVSMLLV